MINGSGYLLWLAEGMLIVCGGERLRWRWSLQVVVGVVGFRICVRLSWELTLVWDRGKEKIS